MVSARVQSCPSKGTYVPSCFALMSLSRSSTVVCSSCQVNRMAVDSEGKILDPHGMCIQCVGQSHDPWFCSYCERLDKSALAKREIQRKAWIHSGVFMSRSKAVAYLKDKGLDTSFREEFNTSFRSLSSSSHASHVDSGVRDQPSATFVPSSVVLSVASTVQTVSTTTSQSVFPTSAPIASATFGPPQANSTADSLASAFADQSTISSVQHHHATPVPSQTSDPNSSLDTVECRRVQAIDAVCLDLAPHLGLTIVDRNEEGGIGPQTSQTLSLFPRKKSRKTALFSVPPEFLSRHKFYSEHRPRPELVTSAQKQMFRLTEDQWAQLQFKRCADPILLARTRHKEKFSKQGRVSHVLSDPTAAHSISFVQSVGHAASHAFRINSAAAVSMQFVLDTLQTCLDSVSSFPFIQAKLQSALAASQIGLSAVAESSEIFSRIQGAAAFQERDLWLEASRLPKQVVKEAKTLPLPLGSVDQDGKLVTPRLLGDRFDTLVSQQYKTQKYADKVVPDFKKPEAPFSSQRKRRKPKGSSAGPPSKKKRQTPKSSPNKGSQSFRGRGRGRGSRSRGKSGLPPKTQD